jgi:hypothetical protein
MELASSQVTHYGHSSPGYTIYTANVMEHAAVTHRLTVADSKTL